MGVNVEAGGRLVTSEVYKVASISSHDNSFDVTDVSLEAGYLFRSVGVSN
jgi:hypothetical protein